MKKTINFYEFQKAFEQLRPNDFTPEGLVTLWEYFEDYEQCTGEDIELDVIAISCEYIEYKNLKEFHNDYNKQDFPNTDVLMDFTTVIHIDDKSFIIAEF